MSLSGGSPETTSLHSAERYEYHHAKWIEARREALHSGDFSTANRHLYALRAHLYNLGWLAPEYDQPGYGVPNHA